jgi:DMSO/TMAO reductase YedYZ heme-binding membrane subunit
VLAVDSEALWYLTRGSGLVSLLLLTFVAVLGIAQVQQLVTAGRPQFVVAGLHRNVSLLAVVFIGIHVATTVVDSYAPIGWLDAVIPFRSAYRPIWLGLGALAFDLLLAVMLTSLLRRRLRYGTWKAVHWLAYACWPIAFVHGLGTGTDGSTTWVLAVDAICLVAIVGALGWRLGTARTASPARRIVAAAATLAVVAVIVGWAFAGPASAGWARRAGTPDDLLAAGDQPGSPGAPTTAAPAGPSAIPVPFSDQLDATLDEESPAGGSNSLVIDGTITGDVAGQLHLELSGPPARGGGLRLASGQLTLGPPTDPTQASGQVTSLRGNTVTASVTDAAGGSMTVTINLQLDPRADRATGTVTGARPTTGG